MGTVDDEARHWHCRPMKLSKVSAESRASVGTTHADDHFRLFPRLPSRVLGETFTRIGIISPRVFLGPQSSSCDNDFSEFRRGARPQTRLQGGSIVWCDVALSVTMIVFVTAVLVLVLVLSLSRLETRAGRAGMRIRANDVARTGGVGKPINIRRIG